MNPQEAKELTALIMAEVDNKLRSTAKEYHADYYRGYFTAILETALSAPTLLVSRFKTENK